MRAGPICALIAALALLGAPAEGAKKKGKGRGVAEATVTTIQPIPDTPDFSAPHGTLRSTVSFGKRFKGATIGDVNVTLQTVGATPTAAGDLEFRLIAPRGNTAELIFGTAGLAGQSIGPLTFDDETPIRLCFDDMPPCSDPDTLILPYIGTVQPTGGFLSDLDGGPIGGTWTLMARDALPMQTSSLTSWTVTVTRDRPAK
jgi:hypothetical protein